MKDSILFAFLSLMILTFGVLFNQVKADAVIYKTDIPVKKPAFEKVLNYSPARKTAVYLPKRKNRYDFIPQYF